jgi:putative membrane-bound dehydrogenase-like protein
MRLTLMLAITLVGASISLAGETNRLAYLDESDPYYVSRTFPKLTTPQWVGEDGVEAVIIIAIDDMRDPRRYEAFLRPILDRLKQIDGRAPVSIMTNQIDPASPQLQGWLKEGVSLEIHTIDHPCPLLAGGDFGKAKSTYDRCVDLLNAVPGNRPVAFRMPCCDSLNTPSPRFYSEIFNKTTPAGKFLTIDSSVFNIITPNDPDLPRDLVFDPDGRQRFRKYVPFPSFVNTIEDYPYPYVIGRLCWEFPCVTPSDWQAQNIQKPNNPATVRDMQAVVDATVLKQGTFTLVFHPHGWIRNDQIVELIDHAVAKHGKKVKFLTFRDAQYRLDQFLLGGQPLRNAAGQDNGARLIDLNNDGYLDVVIGNETLRQTRIWSPKTRSWLNSDFPAALTDAGARFGGIRESGQPSLILHNETIANAWTFNGSKWMEDKSLLKGLDADGPIFTSQAGHDRGVRLHDLDGDGRCELFVSNDRQQAIFQWNESQNTWLKLPFALPAGVSIVDTAGRDAGLRFVDLDEDGFDDVVVSNDERSAAYLFDTMQTGWARAVPVGQRGQRNELPRIVRNGASNGAWFHSRHLWVQNEDTAKMPDHVDRRAFGELLGQMTPQAKSPAASLRSIRVAPGFVVEQVAAEPLVQDPVAFAWGPDGKLWVVEMGDYPLGVDGKGKPGGRVKFLEDTNGDGKYVKATLFLDGLGFPTGVMPWGKGVIVTCAPEIFYAEDTDGDGKADLRRPLFTGFNPGNQQHRVNGPVWGLDNWIYCANGHSGGRIRSTITGAQVSISGRDFRFRPDDGILDPQTGQTQFGRAQDDWGNWFGCDNLNPLYHFALADHYMRRNPNAPSPNPVVYCPVTTGLGPVYPVSPTQARFNDVHTLNHFTSACATTIYRDDLFGPQFAGNNFVSEPVHNLVSRAIVSAEGVTFSSHRAPTEERSEFLASTDNWFRPTTLRTGPDGALWVADMYRYVIEHPEWIPKDWQKRLDLRAGSDKGRIYRVYPVGKKPRPIPRLDRLDIAGLVAALDSPSGWQRDLAQQMLVEKKDPAAAPLLRKQAAESRNPLARLHSLCALDGLGGIDSDILKKALRDGYGGVRRHAVRLCEGLLGKSPELGEAMSNLAGDPDAQVRMQVAYSLGYWNDARAGAALAQIALHDASDRFIAAAILSSLNDLNLEPMMRTLIAGMSANAVPSELLENLLRMAGASGNDKVLVTVLTAIGTPADAKYATWQYAALSAVLDVLEKSDRTLAKLLESNDADLKSAARRLVDVFDSARKLAAQPKTPTELRMAALWLLGRGPDRAEEDLALLASMLTPQTNENVQSAAIATLARHRDPATVQILLRPWKSYGLSLRARVLDALLSRPEWAGELLNAVDRKLVVSADFDAARRQRLLQSKSVEIRDRAFKLFADVILPNRQKVIDSYSAALTITGDTARGKDVFAKTCSTCHKIGDVGHSVGPDLASMADQSAEALLIAIVDPNRAVEPKFTNYVADTKSGLNLSGILSAETSSSVTLLGPNAEPQTLLRSDLKSLRSTGLSLMPEGLEAGYKPQDLADLIAFMRSGAAPAKPKSYVGNKPQLVRSAANGVLRLLPADCEIYGKTLLLEPEHDNLGYWYSDDDHAVWSVDVAAAGKYAVRLDYACPDDSAGNTFLLQAGSAKLTGVVVSTGHWDNYRKADPGQITLEKGPQRIVFRPAGRLNKALLDLRSIELTPLGP